LAVTELYHVAHLDRSLEQKVQSGNEIVDDGLHAETDPDTQGAATRLTSSVSLRASPFRAASC